MNIEALLEILISKVSNLQRANGLHMDTGTLVQQIWEFQQYLEDLLYIINPNNEIVEDRHDQQLWNIKPRPLNLSQEGSFTDDNNK